jgi:DNA-directed RNA polymerase subunit N (RpoN/RPB10)
MFSVRCFSCGKVLKHINHVQNLSPEERIKFWNENNITRLCCKTRYLTSVDVHSVEYEFKF